MKFPAATFTLAILAAVTNASETSTDANKQVLGAADVVATSLDLSSASSALSANDMHRKLPGDDDEEEEEEDADEDEEGDLEEENVYGAAEDGDEGGDEDADEDEEDDLEEENVYGAAEDGDEDGDEDADEDEEDDLEEENVYGAAEDGDEDGDEDADKDEEDDLEEENEMNMAYAVGAAGSATVILAALGVLEHRRRVRVTPTIDLNGNIQTDYVPAANVELV
jgi:hypothetical protein